MHRSRVLHGVILYVRYTDHESNMPSFCIMSDTQITSPTWSHSVCQIHRSRVQHVVILYNGRYTDHESKCIWHTEWLHVGLVICVSDIIQNDGMLDLWSVYLTLYRMMMDSWSVYLPLYRMTTCWTRDLCIWHFTEWRHVGLVISCCHSV